MSYITDTFGRPITVNTAPPDLKDWVHITYARSLEQALAAADKRIKRLEEHITRLEVAGYVMEMWCCDGEAALKWKQAKEAKP